MQEVLCPFSVGMFEPEYIGERVFVPYRDGKDAFVLHLWDTLAKEENKTRIAYRFVHNGETIFSGADIQVPESYCVDSDVVFGTVLSFLCLRPGDTDADYFADYTQEQMDFCEQHAEFLALEAYLLINPESDESE